MAYGGGYQRRAERPDDTQRAARTAPGAAGPRESGAVKKWFDDRGFGFIAPDAGGADVFVHVRDCGGLDTLRIGERVTYAVTQDQRSGKAKAVAVRIAA